ncbi:MAG TPA: Rid family detoxifying hydrolase [Planctomycetota bacterium]|jgi:2-iminobutanoate/2-iminopropanoate deaminase
MAIIRPIVPATVQGPLGPYSPAVVCNNMVFVSGQIPTDSFGTIVGSSIEAATQQALDNLRSVLVAAGCTPAAVVKTTVFLTDLADFDGMNRTYATFFGSHRPARSTVQVSKLPAGARVEIECIAVL